MSADFRTCVIFGILSAAFLWAAAGLSGDFSEFPGGLKQMPILQLVSLLCASSVFYLAAVHFSQSCRLPSAAVFAIGLAMRAAGFVAHPVLEDDYFRYLWDGAVTAEGINPYLFSPVEAVSGKAGESLKLLAEQSGEVAARINHPHLTTIYPPAAQAFFAVSHLLSEWSVTAWRLVLLCADTATFFLLRAMCRERASEIIYWWNPLAVFTIFFSCHFEALIFPFVLTAVWACERNGKFASAALLSISVAVKLWTAVLIAPIARNFGDWKKALAPFAFFLTATALVISPLIAAGFAENSGLGAYAGKWENNSALFKIVLFASEKAVEFAGFHPGHGQIVARIAVASTVAFGAIYICFSKSRRKNPLAENCLFLSALIFLVIPAQLPWYYCWLLPFLALRKSGAKWSLLILTALLPLYYTKFHFEPRGSGAFGLIVWIEFAPVWAMLAFESLRGKMSDRR